MYLVRPVEHNDLDDLLALAEVMAPGITTFPPERTALEKKIAASIASFTLNNDNTVQRSFLLVLEDTENHRIAGTAGIYNQIGQDKPFYSYKVTTQTQVNQTLNLSSKSKVLHLVNAFQGATEVGTLLLHPDYNGKGLGKLLAKSRYLLIKSFSELFFEPVFAELRGWTDNNNNSPFWDAIGNHFFAGLAFDKADLLSATTDNQFIADLMPRYPIYVDLLPESAQEVIGKANRKGQAALQMLFDEGFRDEHYIDIFDAGITVTAKFEDIVTIRESREVRVDISDNIVDSSESILICNSDIEQFRVIQSSHYQINDNSLLLNTNDYQVVSPKHGTVLIY